MFHLENHSGRGGQIVTNVVCTQNQKVRVLEYQGAQTAIKIATVNYITATKYSDIKKKKNNKQIPGMWFLLTNKKYITSKAYNKFCRLGDMDDMCLAQKYN